MIELVKNSRAIVDSIERPGIEIVLHSARRARRKPTNDKGMRVLLSN